MSERPYGAQPDDLQVALQAMGDLLAAVPYRLGYRLEDSGQLVLQHSAADRRRLVVLDWQTDRSVADASREAARTVAALAGRFQPDAILILGYGPEAAERVYALREEVRTASEVSLAAVQVDQGQWRAFGVNVTGPWHRMPEVPVSVLLEGYPPPAASLGEHQRLYDPLPQPSYGALPENSRDLIDAAPPDIKAELATRALHRITQRSPHPLDLAALTHALATPAVNHNIVADAYQDRACTSALVDAYRGAPPEQRPAVAAAAATALWLRGQIQEARQVLTHLPDGNYFAATRRHLSSLIRQGASPSSLAPDFQAAAASHMQHAEAAWAAEHPAAPKPADPPAPHPPAQPKINGPQP